jgi:transposase
LDHRNTLQAHLEKKTQKEEKEKIVKSLNFCGKCFEKQRKIDDLTKEVERLRGKLHRQERKEKEGPFGPSTPSSKIPFKPNTPEEEKKMGGAKRGHQGHGRNGFEPEEVDREEDVFLSFDKCPDCEVLLEEVEPVTRSVLDLPPVKTQKVLMNLEKKECPCCHRWFTAKAPGVLPNFLLSNELLTYIVTSHYLYGIPLGRIVKPLGLNRGTVIAALHRLAGFFEGVIPYLTEEYRQSKVKHADETGWRNDGQSGYAWVFCARTVALFLCRHTRSSTVPREVFGEGEVSGVCDSDTALTP